MFSKGLEALAALAAAANSSGQGPNPQSGGLNTTNDEQRASSNPGPSLVDSRLQGLNVANQQAAGNLPNLSASQVQHLQQVLANLNSAALSNQNSALLGSLCQNLQHVSQAQDSSTIMAVQNQINYLNLLIQAQSNQTSFLSHAAAASNLRATLDGNDAASRGPNQAAANASSSRNPGEEKIKSFLAAQQQILPGGSTSSLVNNANSQSAVAASNSSNVSVGSSSSSMPPPPPIAPQPAGTSNNSAITTGTGVVTLSTTRTSNPPILAAIAPQPSLGIPSVSTISVYEEYSNDKRQLKRAANRKSAQLSRKRKKQFIEELKDENDDLKRKEQILRSIPDLIVVFDSSGRLWFVSESVGRFIDFTADELEGTSFWDRLCEDSVRLLKAAFMDSLAERQPDSDSAPLGSGIWELRLLDKDGSLKIVLLNGVVHFAGDRPECICSIRPRDDVGSLSPKHSQGAASSAEQEKNNTRSPSSLSTSSWLRIKPCQSVINHHGSDSTNLLADSVNGSSISNSNVGKSRSKKHVLGKRAGAVRISDSGNSSAESDSGSSDEMMGAVSSG